MVSALSLSSKAQELLDFFSGGKNQEEFLHPLILELLWLLTSLETDSSHW